MERKAFQQLTTSVEEDLIKGRLRNAQTTLSNLLDVLKAPVLGRELTSLQADYERLLSFMIESTDDPQRPKIHARLLQKTFRVLQNLRRIYHIDNDEDIYSLTARSLSGTWKEQYDSLVANPALDADVQDQRFTVIWVSPQLNINEERLLRLSLLGSDSLSRRYMLSAIILSLFHYFDVAKVRLLLEYSESSDDNERAYAIVGLIIVCLLYPQIFRIYPSIHEQLSQLLSNKRIVDEVARTQHLFSLYQESEQLRKKMENEIFPALIKAAQERKRLGFDTDEINIDDPDIALNLSKETRKTISESAQQMFNMFKEGADVNLHTFSALKRFPFFRHVGHWLAPFDPQRKEVAQAPKFIHRLQLCDNDLYSIALLLLTVPEEQRKQMTEALTQIPQDEAQQRINSYSNVVQCLYRLLHRSPWQALWPEVFSQQYFIDNPILGPLLNHQTRFLNPIAQTLLRHNHFAQAEKHMQKIVKQEGSNAEILYQLAFCQMHQGNFMGALRNLQQAHLLVPEQKQITLNLQHCYARLGRYEEQLECLQELEEKYPDDVHIQTETGLCLIQLERWEEAQKRFYRLEYRGHRVLPSQRAVAWCALRMGDLVVAKRYYERLLTNPQAKWEDYLNMGHVHWLSGETAQALPLYHEYVRRYATSNPKSTDLMIPFDQDFEVLRQLGKSATDIAIMRDLIIS